MLTLFLLTIIYAIGGGLFVSFIDFCFNEGNIFDFWYEFIQNKLFDDYPKLFKVLGGCVFCFGFWVNLFLFIIFSFVLNLTSPIFLLLFPLFVGFSQLTIKGYIEIFG
jgi:hypothetical protein